MLNLFQHLTNGCKDLSVGFRIKFGMTASCVCHAELVSASHSNDKRIFPQKMEKCDKKCYYKFNMAKKKRLETSTHQILTH